MRDLVASWRKEHTNLKRNASQDTASRRTPLHVLLDGRDKPRLLVDAVSRDLSEGLAAKATEQAAAPASKAELAQGKHAWASVEDASHLAIHAVDGNEQTRWASGRAGAPLMKDARWPQWLAVDLGQDCSLSQIRITWGDAYAAAYEIYGRVDGDESDEGWKLLDEVLASWPGLVVTSLEGKTARYVRVLCLRRGTIDGYSIAHLEVY